MLKSINPATGELIREYTPLERDDIQPLIRDAHESFNQWRSTPLNLRLETLYNIAESLSENESRLAALITEEMGKPLRESRGEIQKCASVCRYYAEHAQNFLLPRPYASDASDSFVCYEPIGLVLAVMPWNFPFWQVFRFAAPAIAAGNGCLLKHASNVSGCALAIESLFTKAGLPSGVFTTLLLESQNVKHVISHPNVRAVTLTGSAKAGAAVAAEAGKHLKKSVLELGGSDPYLVLSDADLELAAEKIVASRMLNCGQSCIGAKRVIALEGIQSDLETNIIALLENLKTGDPAIKESDLGPLVNSSARETVHSQVTATIEAGAKCAAGGKIPEGQGYYYPPTLLTKVPKNSPAYKDEIFGPVISIISASSEQEAVDIANTSSFGLGAAVFSKDTDNAHYVAQQIDAGCCFINDFVKSDPRLPFGGVKDSGYGRELSDFGLYEFTNVKTVVKA